MNNPYAPPSARVSDLDPADAQVVYAGFWRRFVATFIDGLILMAITVPLLLSIYGSEYFLTEQDSIVRGPADFLISYVFPLVLTLLFWKYRAATPGKMLLKLKIVDAENFGPMSTGQLVGRYFAYIPSALVLGLGFLWVAFDARKQAWHDKLARTVVIRS